MVRAILGVAALVAVCGGTAVAADPQFTQESTQVKPNDPQSAPGESQPKADKSQPKSDESASKRSVPGFYKCEGTNPDGSPYQGLVQIAAIDDTYLVHWILSNGAEVLGVGIVRSGVLSVSYFGGTPALAVYRIDGERLLGEWTMGGAEGMVYSETLTKMAVPPADHASPAKPAKPARPSNTRPVAGVRAI
jgi:hypothetical protein